MEFLEFKAKEENILATYKLISSQKRRPPEIGPNMPNMACSSWVFFENKNVTFYGFRVVAPVFSNTAWAVDEISTVTARRAVRLR